MKPQVTPPVFLSFLHLLRVSVSVRRHRQYPHQPRHPQPADSGEQVGHRSHARLSGSVLQLLVRYHAAGECELDQRKGNGVLKKSQS